MKFRAWSEATLWLRNTRRVTIQCDSIIQKLSGALDIKAHAVNPPLREDSDFIRAVMALGVRVYKAEKKIDDGEEWTPFHGRKFQG